MPEVMVTPAIELQCVFNPDGSRAFQVRFTPLPLDVKDTELDEMLNRVLRAVDRQTIYYDLLELDERLKDKLEILKKYEGLVIALEAQAEADYMTSGRRGDWNIDKMGPHHKSERDRVRVSLQRDRADADALDEKVKRLQARRNGHAFDISSDRQSGMS